MVAFTNDYGVVFGPYEILAFEEPWNGGRCVYLDSDAYWLADRPSQLTLMSKRTQKKQSKHRPSAIHSGCLCPCRWLPFYSPILVCTCFIQAIPFCRKTRCLHDMRHGLFSRAKLRWTNAVQVPPWLPPMKFDGNFPKSQITAFHKISFPVPCPLFLPPPLEPHVKQSLQAKSKRLQGQGK